MPGALEVTRDLNSATTLNQTVLTGALGGGMDKLKELEQKCDDLHNEGVANSIAALQKRCLEFDARTGAQNAMLDSLTSNVTELQNKLRQQRAEGEKSSLDMTTTNA